METNSNNKPRKTMFQVRKQVQESMTNLMRLYVTPKHIIIDQFEPDPNQTLIQSKLQIDRQSCKIQELKLSEKVESSAKCQMVYGLVGLIKFFQKSAVVFVEEAELSCIIQGEAIYQVKKVSIVYVDARESEQQLDVQEKEFINHMSRFFQSSFFFSYTYDLTSHSQKKYLMLNSSHLQQSMISVKQNTNRFWWNMHMLKPLIREGLSAQWQLKMIQGYVGAFNTTLKSNKHVEYYLISRRQWIRSGTLKNHTGIDEEGYVANYVETEQILIIDHLKSSFVFVRGSLPMFWQKLMLSSKVELTQDNEQQKKAFIKHFTNLVNNYTKVACVNLLGKSKENDMLLSFNFEKIYYENKLDNLAYHQIDFETICKDYEFHNLNEHIEKLHPITSYFDYFFHDPKNTQMRQQKGVFRVNCLDCLDQTNIFMTKLALKVAQNMLSDLGVNIKHEFNSLSLVQEADQPSIQNLHPFIIYFKQKWAENGDFITKVYSPMQTQHRPVQHSKNRMSYSSIILFDLKLIDRYYRQILDDKLKSDVIDQIVGNTIQSSLAMTNIKHLEKFMKQRDQEYIRLHPINVYVVTWNINAHIPNNPFTHDFFMLFDLKGNEPPNLIAVAIQELVKLNAVNVVGKINQQQIQQWRAIIELSVNKMIGPYTVAASSDMVGCLLFVLVKKEEQNKIRQIEVDAVKCGFGQQLGNKGGVIIKLTYYDSQICFINCHLPAGQKKIEERLTAFDIIHQKAFQQEKSNLDAKIENCDWAIFVGDTNFRMNLPYQQALDLIQIYKQSKATSNLDTMKNILTTMKENDQLKTEKNKSFYLNKYQEGEISFLQTYKFDIGTETYDTSKKLRVPSWTDRILYWNIQNIKNMYPVFYESLSGPFQVSDHRPVGCYLKTEVCQIEENKRDAVFQDVIKQFQEEQIEWANRYYDRTAMINGTMANLGNFDSSNRNRSKIKLKKGASQFIIDYDEEQSPKKSLQSRAGGRKLKVDLETLTHPYPQLLQQLP